MTSRELAIFHQVNAARANNGQARRCSHRVRHPRPGEPGPPGVRVPQAHGRFQSTAGRRRRPGRPCPGRLPWQPSQGPRGGFWLNQSPHGVGQLNGHSTASLGPSATSRGAPSTRMTTVPAPRAAKPFCQALPAPLPFDPGSGRERKRLVMLEQTWPPRPLAASQAPVGRG